MTKSLLQLVMAAARHVATETNGDLEGILATLEGEPVYDFYPVGRRLSGMNNTRRYYEHFVANAMPRIVDVEQHGEWIGDVGVVQEFTLSLEHPHAGETTSHRIIAILTFGEERLSGERMYSDEVLFRALLGPLWDELDEIPG
ncbi:MAG: nuclear transport factor 2 family protein [Pseudomonadales bacterium]|jgi:hypothetical protein|nr:nuclear transport factor 2 family protein [Gammaproteobacteria bacterium]MBP6053803.1 nuclear transport factor 2 family protein [Pseudomonadales bacterium]MBK6583886.1 nuclear transport factor 2 family protein [Gammaproteobacteria bacterium]MBK7169786.1 nuclear transport factor 2 family protein [Gammaproteobacteria bacterium]MBK7522221.1 nuclear transport factor 2 family protein [Gammaproteobacteria bacterium]